MFIQTSTEAEAAAGRLPLVLSYPLDLPKKGTLKRKKFDNQVAKLFASISNYQK